MGWQDISNGELDRFESEYLERDDEFDTEWEDIDLDEEELEETEVTEDLDSLDRWRDSEYIALATWIGFSVTAISIIA